jgi:outer membrane protein assembly factor BamB
MNAADGKPLWSTAATEPRGEVSYAGLPAVAGRYVYGVAVRRTGPSTAELSLAALDVTTGNALWQTVLGSVAEQGEQRLGGRKNVRSEPLNLDGFLELSEPAVAGDLVVVSPNCGAAIAVDRFDGKIRWVGVYRPSEAPDARGLGAKPLRFATRADAAAAVRLRYRSTPVVCGDAVVVMPQDAPAVFAFDRAGGRRLWDSDLQPAEAFGLAGGAGNMAVLCGTTLTGIDAGGTGKRKWRYVPPRGTELTGPAVVVGSTVIAPATEGFVQLNVADGTAAASAYAVPNFRAVVETAGGRAAVTEAGATRAFGVGER